MLSTSVKHMLYLPNQVIVNKGDIGHEMYFIHKGRVEVHRTCICVPYTVVLCVKI